MSSYRIGILVGMLMVVGSLESTTSRVRGQDNGPPADIGFIGLHGGMYELLQKHADPLNLKLTYFEDGAIQRKEADLSRVKVLVVQHTRAEDRESYQALIRNAKSKNPELRIIVFQASSAELFRGMGLGELLQEDEKGVAYYGSSSENLRRLLVYLGSTYLEQPWKVEAPQEIERRGFYHPDLPEIVPTSEGFLVWARSKRELSPQQPRVLIAVHSAHLFFQQPLVVDALIRESERQGAIAVAIIDGRSKDYEEQAILFAPSVVIHTCHSTDAVPFRLKLNVPHLHSIFLRKQTITEWQSSLEGLTSSELAFHVIGQELIGGIEPQVAGGTTKGQGSSEAIVPIPDRVQHLVGRALSLAKLSSVSQSTKRVGIVYYDREMGKGELMRGSATGMHMNGPRSLLNVLHSMSHRGYSVEPLPSTEDELLDWMIQRGRQVGAWAPAELDRLVQTGSPQLIPAKLYEQWYLEKVPEDRRRQMEEKWGPPPGRFMVWEKSGQKYIVVPKVQLGNVVLLPQPLRGELHGRDMASMQTHDKLTTPPHNYLATYFWLEKEFQANAVIHFGTHGSEFALPGKPNGLSQRDWPDILMGHLPNFNPWIIENMVESTPVRRRVYGTLISHLPPPIVDAGLSDELANLHEMVDKWESMEEGALKEGFRKEIARQVRQTRLDIDLHLGLQSEDTLSDDAIKQVSEYLHKIQEETTPTSLHVFGQPPREDLFIPYLVQILRSPFLKDVEVLLGESAAEGTKRELEHSIRPTAETIVDLVVRKNIDPRLAVSMAIGRDIDSLPESIAMGLELAKKVKDNFDQTGNEVTNLLDGLDGKFVPPGPGNSPIRNPNAVPTGRNMYLLNPEEVPTRPSWELGVKLSNALIENHQKQHGNFPTKIGFDLRSSATFRDYGVMEAQILYLLGVEPVWDERQLVNDVRLIPRDQLGRPRIDVMIAAGNWYESNLPTRLQLWDKALQLVNDADEPDNPIRANSLENSKALQAQGLQSQRAQTLSRGRIFGVAPGNEQGSFLGYQVARSGDWDTRDEIATSYLNTHKYIYTAEAWGEEAAIAYDRTIQGTHTVVRSWSDHMTGPLASKYTWLHGGALSLAVEKMTGKKPEFLFSDVRDPDQATMIHAEDALRREFRVRLFNRKWLEGMMKEGYAGADHMRVMASNSFAWEVMRPGSIGNDQWDEMKRVLIDDRLKLGLKDWFEKNNPYAYQDTMAAMLEAVRKGYWQADEETLRELAKEYASNVARHGMSGHMTSGGNQGLDQLVTDQLKASQEPAVEKLLASYREKIDDQLQTSTASAPAPTSLETAALPSKMLDAAPEGDGKLESNTTNSTSMNPTSKNSPTSDSPPINKTQSESISKDDSSSKPMVQGKVLEKVNEAPTSDSSPLKKLGLIMIAIVALFGFGFLFRQRH